MKTGVDEGLVLDMQETLRLQTTKLKMFPTRALPWVGGGRPLPTS